MSLFRHVASFFLATEAELAALLSLVHDARRLLDERYDPDGYTIGVNFGTAAGQSVMHQHLHVIPRYVGDMEDPKGGVRGGYSGEEGILREVDQFLMGRTFPLSSLTNDTYQPIYGDENNRYKVFL